VFFHFTESTSIPEERHLRENIFDSQEKELKMMPVAEDIPIEQRVVNVNFEIGILKIIALV